MDRSPRLRRYQRKDYTQRVDFPVEIVGRDNLVRRYSFDEAVRLYRRRISSAPIRYDDPDMIDAEVRHCKSRIEQLRRSYIEHAGWGWARDGAARGVLGTPLAAEIGCFLRRAFQDDSAIGGGLSLAPVAGGDCDVCFLRPAGGERGYLLYCYRLDDTGPIEARAAFERDLARLRSAASDPDAERLFAAQVSPDLGLILAGVGTWDGPEIDIVPSTDTPPEPEGPVDHFREGMRAMHDGDAAAAQRHFEQGMDAEPDRKMLSQAAALLALLHRESERGEFASRFGLLHHPHDPLLAYLLAVSLLQARRDAEARAVVGAHPGQEPGFVLLRGLFALRDHRWLRAWLDLRRARREVPEDNWFIARMAMLAQRAMVRALASVILAAASAAMGVVAGLGGHWILGSLAVVMAFVLVAVAMVRLDTRARRAMFSPASGVRLVSPELMPRGAVPGARN